MGGGIIPIGTLVPYVGNTSPNEYYLICDGSEFDIEKYTILYNLLGSNLLPNLCGRTIIGVDETYALNSVGGESEHTLTISEMPSHNHLNGTNFDTVTFAKFGIYWGGGSVVRYISTSCGGYTASGYDGGTPYTNTVGGDTSHNNMQPYIALNYIIRAK